MTTAHRKSPGEESRSPVARRFLRLGLIALLAAAVALASGVGWLALRDDGQPSVRLLIDANLSQLLAGTVSGDAMQQIQRILETRAQGFGASGTDVSVESGNRLSITLRNIALDGARELFLNTGYPEARQPVLDNNRRCLVPHRGRHDVYLAAGEHHLYPGSFQRHHSACLRGQRRTARRDPLGARQCKRQAR